MWRFVLVLGGVLGMAIPAYGQSNVWKVGTCEPQDQIESFLYEQYEEKAVAGGITNGKKYAELWVSEEKTWTMILHLSDGKVCLMGSGEGWRNYEEELEGEVL